MDEKLVNWTCLGIMTASTMSQAHEVFRIIQLIITSLSALVVLAYNIYKWVVRAKADGKIDKKEVNELLDILDEGNKAFNEITKKDE